MSIYIKLYISVCLFVCLFFRSITDFVQNFSFLDSKLSRSTFIRKIIKIVIYYKARVNGETNYDYPGQRWVPKLVFNPLLVCLVCLFSINVKTAEPIRPEFVEATRMTPKKDHGWSNLSV